MALITLVRRIFFMFCLKDQEISDRNSGVFDFPRNIKNKKSLISVQLDHFLDAMADIKEFFWLFFLEN